MQDKDAIYSEKSAEALAVLEEAWAYFTPAPVLVPEDQREPELFEYANAA